MSVAHKVPLSAGRVYVDRSMRRWYVERVVNEGMTFAAKLPAMALARCIDAITGPSVVRHPQWFDATTWRWVLDRDAPDTPLDLVRAA